MMHESTFQYLKPTVGQAVAMDVLRKAAADYAHVIEQELPDGPDKTYVLRKLREVAMWTNVAVTRYSDGAPRLNGAAENAA